MAHTLAIVTSKGQLRSTVTQRAVNVNADPELPVDSAINVNQGSTALALTVVPNASAMPRVRDSLTRYVLVYAKLCA